jgi:hypothetical protein
MELDISHRFKNLAIFYEAPRSTGTLKRIHCWLLEPTETKCVITSFLSSTLSLMIITNNTVFVSGWVLSVAVFFKFRLILSTTVGVEGGVCTLSHSKIHTHSVGLLDEGSSRRRDFYLHNTQFSHKTNIHFPGGIRTRNPCKPAAADLRLRSVLFQRLQISIIPITMFFVSAPHIFVGGSCLSE